MKTNQKKELILLHFSDFHFGRQNPYSGQNVVLKEIWDEIKRKIYTNGIKLDDINLLVVTGDLSSIGSVKDFEFAYQFFNEILFKDISKDKFIIIPGNHDLEFAMNTGDLKEDRFENYLKFKRKAGFDDENVNSIEYLKSPHFFKIFKEISTCILCLNSCLYTAYDIDPDDPLSFNKSKFNPESENFAKVNENQLKSCLATMDSNKSFDFNFSLIHHNILGYKKGRAYVSNFYKLVDILKNKKFNLILHGHLHKKIIDNYKHCTTIGAGSFGVGNNYKDVLNGMNLIKLRKENYPFPITWVDVLTIKIDYEEKLERAVIFPQDWITETLEMPTSTYYAILSHVEIVKSSILNSKYNLALENIQNLQLLLYHSKIKDKENIIRQLGDIFYNEFKKISKRDVKRFEVLEKLQDKIIEFKSGKTFAWSPLKRLMKSSGAIIVARDAIDRLIDEIDKSVKLSRREYRKKITKEDMKRAIR